MRMKVLLAIIAVLSVAACTGNNQSSSGSSPTPVESTNPVGAMATAAGAMATAASGAAHAVATTAAGAAGAMAGGMAKMTPHTASYALKAENGSGEDGKVTLVGNASKTTVTISLKGENTTGKQPAHIHTGPCSKIGGVKYPLSDVVLGQSVTVVGAPLDALTNGTLAVNVHESAADLGKYVACGDLTKANKL